MNHIHAFIQRCLPATWQLVSEQLFSIHNQQGAIAWAYKTHTQDGDTLHAVFTSQDLDLDVHLRQHPATQALTCQINIRNTSAHRQTLDRIEPLRLQWKSNDGPLHVTTCAGGTNEHHYPPSAFREDRVRADDSTFVWIENGFDGRSSNFHIPIMSMEVGDHGVSGGLAWSGLWWMSAKGDGQGAQTLSCHIPVDGLVLEPGECLALPTAHYVFSDATTTASNAMRRYIREALVPQTPEPLKSQAMYNHWFGIGPDINAEVFKRQCDQAKALNMRYVVLDAGWYGGCTKTNFGRGVGNWERIDHEKFPDGLEDVSQYASSLGLKFGLWFEIERAHRESDWATQHPDWFIDIGKDHMHIDMSNDDAVDACIDLVSNAVQQYDCHWLKLDYNIGPRDFWQHKDPSGKIQFSYMNGLYRFFQTLRERHPHVILENCASGGRRIDLGTIAQTHVQNLTDQTFSAAICRYMMHGAQQYLPANICPIGMPHGNRESHGVEDQAFSLFHILSRFSGLPTLYGDIANYGPRTLAIVKQALALHQDYATVFHGDFYRLTPQAVGDSDVEAVIHLDAKAGQGLLLIFSGHETTQHPLYLDTTSIAEPNQYTLQAPPGLDQSSDLPLAGKTLHEINNMGFPSPDTNSAVVYCITRK